ncbi:MAG: hypothetical protein JW804_09510 [Sedimentisphaerales bacterium]|nr:hypothetical protein [Sedimentisphaerales bacterium]
MRKWALVCGILAIAFLSSMAAGEDDGLSFELTADFYSKYIWRGQLLNDDYVFQTGASAALGNMTFGIWGNLDLTDYTDRKGNFSEVDYSFDWSDDLPGFKGIGYSLGVIYYDFPGTGPAGGFVSDTTEIYWGLSFDTLLSPTITVYHDIDEAEGTYVNLGFSHGYKEFFKIGDTPVGLDIGAGIGWGSGSYNKYYWGTDQSKMQDLSFSVALPVEIAGFTITPSFNYVTLLSDDIRDTDAYSTDSDYFFTGISISKTF